MNDEELKYNWSCFKKCLLRSVGKSALTREEIDDRRFSFGRMVELANKHRVMSQVAHGFLESHIPGTDLYCSYFLSQQQFHRLRQGILVAEIAHLSALLNATGVAHAVRKGITIDHYGYGAVNIRYFNDIDIAIAAADIEEVEGIVEHKTAYTSSSYFDFVAQEIRPLPRETVIMHRIHPDHLPQYTRMSDGPIAIPLQVDFAVDLSWASSEYPIDMVHALATREVIIAGGREIFALNRTYSFIDTYMHLFREAYFKRASLRSDRISKFLDVLLLWETSLNRTLSRTDRDMIESFNLVAPLKWVAFHVDNVFGTGMKAEIDQLFSDPAYELPSNFFQIYQREDGTLREWKGDMDWRLMVDDKEQIYA